MANVTRSFGFISYNSYDFLKDTLQRLVDEKKLLRSCCLYHESVGDEKNHFHCYAEPRIKIDTLTFQDEFVETDLEGNSQSIAIKHNAYDCRSKFDDFYLYGIHDSDYLEAKGKMRELVNIVSDKHIYIGDFKDDIAQAEFYKFKCVLAPYQKIKQLVYDGLTLPEVYIKLRTSFGQFSAVKTAYTAIKKEYDDYLKEQEKLQREEEERLRRGIQESLWNEEDENK